MTAEFQNNMREQGLTGAKVVVFEKKRPAKSGQAVTLTEQLAARQGVDVPQLLQRKLDMFAITPAGTIQRQRIRSVGTEKNGVFRELILRDQNGSQVSSDKDKPVSERWSTSTLPQAHKSLATTV